MPISKMEKGKGKGEGEDFSRAKLKIPPSNSDFFLLHLIEILSSLPNSRNSSKNISISYYITKKSLLDEWEKG